MTKLINLGNCSYVNLKNAATFSLEESSALTEVEVVKDTLFGKFKTIDLVHKKTYCFIVNGEVVYETFADDEAGKAKIAKINSAITSFVRQKGED